MRRRIGLTSLGRISGALAGLSLTAVLSGGCGGAAPEALSLPVAPWAGTAYLQLARERGFDRAEGLTIAIDPFHDPQQIVRDWLRGELSIAPLTGVELVDLCSRQPQRCPVVVLVLHASQGADKLLVHRSIPTLQGLRGRRVGLAPTSLGPFVLSRALDSVGVDIAEVRIVPTQPEAMAAALHHGRVEAVVSFPPFSELVERLGIARPLFDSRSMPGEIVDVLVVDPRFLAANGEAVVKLLRSWQRAHAWARRNPAEARSVLARQLKLSDSAMARLEAGLAYFPLAQQREMLRPGGPISENLRTVRDRQQRLGIVRADAPLPQVSDALVREALRRGPGNQAGLPSAPIAVAPK
jgi:NitT/TauT family transport system substrate-binding protein